jgi:F420-non-reducing hydrogenase iron-sulfur subunit
MGKMTASTNTPEREITLFFCTRQEERVALIFRELNGQSMVRVCKVPLPCSGKLEVLQLTRALEDGAAGVALFACPEGECRYVFGSPRGRGRLSHASRILEEIGLEKERLRRFVLPADPGPEWIKELADWVEKIRGLESIQAR